ncbi:hypothetical protein BDN71DRAFT_1510281 [Pleurotus eryngii]|uniref:Uncharacterized protein n=1 Tax=Pleurotus eryngii TaxID=5323 RepID=A0A9P6DD66_PLEER|nr:hypothetical protein BDN71DRAFT_1510281 [Pleurotus eryngii]
MCLPTALLNMMVILLLDPTITRNFAIAILNTANAVAPNNGGQTGSSQSLAASTPAIAAPAPAPTVAASASAIQAPAPAPVAAAAVLSPSSNFTTSWVVPIGYPYNLPSDFEEGPFYVITQGLNVSVFSGWDTTSPLVTRVSSVIFWSVPSVTTRQARIVAAINNGHTAILP